MKRVTLVAMLVTSALFFTTGCVKFGKCYLCEKTRVLKRLSSSEGSGWFCSECYDFAKDLIEIFD